MSDLVVDQWVSFPCDVCGSPDHVLLGRRHQVVRGRTKSFEMEIEDAACTQCGFLYAPRRPTEAFLHAYYSDAHDLYHSETEISLHYDVEERLATVQRHLPSGARVLEVGAGDGSFTRRLVAAGYDAWGVDPMVTDRASMIARQFVGARAKSDQAVAVDAVVSYFVLEHVQSPSRWLASVAGWLKPGGFIVIEVPDFAAFPRASLNAEHLTHFTPAHLQCFMARHGLAQVADPAARPTLFFGQVYIGRLVDPGGLAAPCDDQLVPAGDAGPARTMTLYRSAMKALQDEEAAADLVLARVEAARAVHPSARVVVWGANEFATRIGQRLQRHGIDAVLVDNARSKISRGHEGFATAIESPRRHAGERAILVACSPTWNAEIVSNAGAAGLLLCAAIDGTDGHALPLG